MHHQIRAAAESASSPVSTALVLAVAPSRQIEGCSKGNPGWMRISTQLRGILLLYLRHPATPSQRKYSTDSIQHLHPPISRTCSAHGIHVISACLYWVPRVPRLFHSTLA
jgi:hypothetical protein